MKSTATTSSAPRLPPMMAYFWASITVTILGSIMTVASVVLWWAELTGIDFPSTSTVRDPLANASTSVLAL